MGIDGSVVGGVRDGGLSGKRYAVVDARPGARRAEALANVARKFAVSGCGGPGDGGAGRVLYVVACAPQVEPAKRALEGSLGEGAGTVRVTTANEFALGVLNGVPGDGRENGGTGGAGAGTGRPLRPLLHFEAAFLNEDMKPLGLDVDRLREMLKFFHRGVTKLEDRDPQWLITNEERLVFETERGLLRETGAVDAFSVANLAIARLEANPGAVSHPLVLVDGWTSLNTASQRLLDLVARDGLAVAGYAGDPGVAAQPYPDAGTLASLLEGRPDARPLPATAPDGAPSAATALWDTPAEEFAGVARWVETRLAEGAAPRDVAVMAPNRPWARRVAAALDGLGVPYALLENSRLLNGDPRDLARCGAPRAFALMELAADGDDPLAWRVWTGFGDRLLNSMPWSGLRARCKATGERPLDVLGSLGDLVAPGEGGGAGGTRPDPFPGAGRLARAVRDAREKLAAIEGLEGKALVDAACGLCGANPREFYALLGDEPADTAPELCARLRALVADPAFPAGADAVRVGFPEAFIGNRVAHVAYCGFVDGFVPGPECFDVDVPPDTKAANLARERAAFERAADVAGEELLLSRFDHEGLTAARAARMEIGRIRATETGRLAVIRPSTFLEG